MNTYLITLTNGSTVTVAAENYTTSAAGALQLIDQLGNVVYTQATWADVAIVPGTLSGYNAVNTVYQPTITRSVPGVAGTAEASISTGP